MASPLSLAGGSVRLALRVTPKAARTAIGGLRADAEGRVRLLVGVTAPPENGKANKAVIKLLAKAWRLPKSAFDVVAGATDRNKVLAIETGEDPRLLVAQS